MDGICIVFYFAFVFFLVNKNGELFAKLEQKVVSNNDRNTNSQPDTKVQLSVDIPSKGIHKSASYTEPPRKRDSKYRGGEFDKKNYVSIKKIFFTFFFTPRSIVYLWKSKQFYFKRLPYFNRRFSYVNKWKT